MSTLPTSSDQEIRECDLAYMMLCFIKFANVQDYVDLEAALFRGISAHPEVSRQVTQLQEALRQEINLG